MICRDSFRDPRRPGQVVGSRIAGVARGGVDTEGVLSIDNEALRIEPLIQAGWQRACLSYGPLERKPGLAFVVYMLNGHNTAQAEPLAEPFGNRVRAWLFGSKAVRARSRIWRWVRSGRVRRVLRQMRWWKALARKDSLHLDENLAIGWFEEEAANPARGGASLVMHATGAENGELWARCGDGFGAIVRGVQNLPIYYIVVLRERDVVYFAGATTPGVYGLPAYPNLRPLAIGPLPAADRLWASIHQSVIGQGGFRCDTRVYETAVAELPEFGARFGGALLGESFIGTGPFEASIGSRWQPTGHPLVRTAHGLATEVRAALLATLAAPAGLVRCWLRLGSGTVAVWFRATGADDRWEVVHDGRQFELAVVTGGARAVVASCAAAVAQDCELQIVDDGRTIAVLANAELLFAKRIDDARLAEGGGIGLALAGTPAGGPWIREIEALPRTIAVPAAVDFGKPWCRTGSDVVVADDFTGAPAPLHGRVTPVGNRHWSRVVGSGEFDVTGDGAVRVRASRAEPSPGRTVYAVDWANPEFAELAATITPPGTDRGDWEQGRAGFVFWQDPHNYVAINIWLSDSYPGASISSFFTVGGWEDVYDAVWSNVGARVRHGVPVDLRVAFDGMSYLVSIDGTAVLYRQLTDIYADCTRYRINKVGLLANWEWGTDTGSRIEAFRARV